MAAERVTVFGGTGFIGRSLVSRLLGAGHSVLTVSRRARPAAAHANLRHLSGDISNPAVIQRAVDAASIVCHLATGGGDTWADYERDCVGAARVIAEACLKAGTRRLVYTSSIAALYLGERRRVDERDGADPNPSARSPYSRGKIGAEAVLLHLHRTTGLPVVIVRPGIVVGAGGNLTHSGLGLWQSATCCIGLGLARTPLPFVLVDDVADALYTACLTAGIEGRSFNLAGDVRLSAREFISELAAASRRRYRLLPRPLAYLQMLEIAKWLLKAAARKPDNMFPSYRHLRSSSLRAAIDSSAAKEALAWKPTADRRRFIAESILANVEPILPGDLRRAAAPSR